MGTGSGRAGQRSTGRPAQGLGHDHRVLDARDGVDLVDGAVVEPGAAVDHVGGAVVGVQVVAATAALNPVAAAAADHPVVAAVAADDVVARPAVHAVAAAAAADAVVA